MRDESQPAASLASPPLDLDYSLTGVNTARAIEMGLAEADWYQSPVSRGKMRKLLERKNGPAIRDTFLLIAILVGTGFATVSLWGTWWIIAPYLVYAAFYGTASDSRWHECGHGTAFRSDWMNNMVYEIASFMVMRESVIWRWSHTRHHSDTIIVGRDPEIQIPRPPDIRGLALALINYGGYLGYYPALVKHAMGRMTEAEKTFVPETEYGKVYRNARLCVLVYFAVILSAIVIGSWIPIFLFVLPQFFGTWPMIVHNTTQHAGLAENVLDHRLNCRTVYMNPISRFMYWNMNYHVEHHMYPLVPYHALPDLHKEVIDDCPPPYRSILTAWREILPSILRQVKDPTYCVKRTLPEPKECVKEGYYRSELKTDNEGWLEVCSGADLDTDDVVRFDHGKKTFALYRDGGGTLYATDGVCTHGNTHLGEGMVKGKTIECSKHNGRFNLADGSPARAPVCRGLATYPVEERGGRVWLNVDKAGGVGARHEKMVEFRVVSNTNVSTFIKELVLEPVGSIESMDFQPGDYLQFDIPVYEEVRFAEFDIPEPYASVWRNWNLFDLKVGNRESGRRNNYSLASNGVVDGKLTFNVRIATPPPGQDCPPGIGSSYMFELKPGDIVSSIGPFGDFHIKPTQKEMVYIGGGAGMAPLRAHIARLFETEKTARRVSYWYGARSKQEIFYDDYFEGLASRHGNFRFEVALSDPLEEDAWTGPKGFIHEVVLEKYLKNHSNLKAVEFYLCGPPMMIKACNAMLAKMGVNPDQIAYDEF